MFGVTATASPPSGGQKRAHPHRPGWYSANLSWRELVATHLLQSKGAGWVTVPEHHASLGKHWQVERRPLEVYEEASSWS